MRLLTQAATGLAFLHARGIVHSDLKADNVLVDLPKGGGDPIAKIADFGLARVRIRIESEASEAEKKQYEYRGMPGATWRFASPEVVSNLKGRSHRLADVWSFGMLC